MIVKISDNYNLILKYIMVIYEGFKEHINNVYNSYTYTLPFIIF